MYEGDTQVGRTNIVIDDDLIARAMRVTGARSKREAVEIALRHLVTKADVYAALRKARGRLPWDAPLDEWRRGRSTNERRQRSLNKFRERSTTHTKTASSTAISNQATSLSRRMERR